ncbi:MAG: cysteine rich repeat-containing protein [Amaricoccus sp.]
MPRPALLPCVAAFVCALAVPALPARADLMSTCAPEIQKFCSDVSRGRGRISACLASEMPRLSAACQGEVQGVMGSPLTPGYVRRALDPAFTAPLPAACAAPAKQLCPGFPAGSARVFACLYARSDRAGKACNDAATATLKGR